jgi:hypothetical protein
MGLDVLDAAKTLRYSRQESALATLASYESHFEGNILDLIGCPCVVSWPGIYCKLWYLCVTCVLVVEVPLSVLFSEVYMVRGVCVGTGRVCVCMGVEQVYYLACRSWFRTPLSSLFSLALRTLSSRPTPLLQKRLVTLIFVNRDRLVEHGKASKLSAAVVFLPQHTLHYGKCGSEKCYCLEVRLVFQLPMVLSPQVQSCHRLCSVYATRPLPLL